MHKILTIQMLILGGLFLILARMGTSWLILAYGTRASSSIEITIPACTSCHHIDIADLSFNQYSRMAQDRISGRGIPEIDPYLHQEISVNCDACHSSHAIIVAPSDFPVEMLAMGHRGYARPVIDCGMCHIEKPAIAFSPIRGAN